MRRIGHKGADLIVSGNTIASFEKAVELGVEMIELDVLSGHADSLLVAHDGNDADGREPHTLAEALDVFTRPPLDRVEIDLDLKLPGGEDELVAELRGRDLVERAMVSTMYVSSLRAIGELEPGLRRGWTYPLVRRDWLRTRWAKPFVPAALASMRRRLPALARRTLPDLGVEAMWVFHRLISPRLVEVTRAASVELVAWTVDDLARMRALRAIGVEAICSNDPRLFAALDAESLRA